MTEPLANPLTKQELLRFGQSGSHAVVLIGPYGAGKGYLANWLARSLLKTNKQQDQAIKQLAPTKGIIGIDEIRGIQSFLKLKAVGLSTVRRVIIIEDAHTMTVEAQNALLKILEEPPYDARLILTTASQQALLPTVLSRLRSATVHPVSKEAMLKEYDGKYSPEVLSRAYALSGGYIGLCIALMSEEPHELLAAVATAKAVLAASTYERLTLLSPLSKDKDKTRALLFALKRILSSMLNQPATHKNKRQVQRITASLITVHDAETALVHNPNMKLLLTSVALDL